MRIILGGDVMLARQIDEHFLAHDRSPFAKIADRLLEADLACVNLECAITARVTWYEGPPKAFYFKARPKAARVLAEANVQLVSLANNHALDAGADGLRDTLTLLDAQGIGHAGAGLDLEEASRPAVAEIAPSKARAVAQRSGRAERAPPQSRFWLTATIRGTLPRCPKSREFAIWVWRMSRGRSRRSKRTLAGSEARVTS